MPGGPVNALDQVEFSDQDFRIYAKADPSKKLAWDVSAIPTGTTVTTGFREVLRSNRTYYVGANIPAPTISVASPAVVTSTAHGLSAGDAVVFNVPLNTKTATISAANPAVVTMANSFVAGQPVKFSSTGSLPYGIVPGTTYYVISAGLSGSQFEFSATVGGSAVSTAAPTAGFTNGSANITITTANTYYSVGQTIRFATTGSLPTNFAAATDYYIVSATSTLITVSATNGGSAIVAGSAGSGTQTAVQSGTHYVSTTGALPTGIMEGTTYYVISAGLTTNAFEVSASQGGAAVNTSGSVTGSPIYNAYTGNDSNNGLAQTRAGAFLTIQKAVNAASALDLNGNNVTIQLALGTYTGAASLSASFVGSGDVTILGNTTTPSNCNISVTSADAISVTNGAMLKASGLRLQTTTGGKCIVVQGIGSQITLSGAMEFGPSASFQMAAVQGSNIIGSSISYLITGGAQGHTYSESDGQINTVSDTISYVGNPAFSISNAFALTASLQQLNNNTYVGSATGQRYSASLNSVIYTGGAGASYLQGNSAGSTATGAQYG